jgi:uncharacterized protein (DUF1501 family)
MMTDFSRRAAILSGPRLSRRAALLGLTSAVSLGRASLALADAPTEQRFVVVILRGALDGLSAVVPYGDPDLMALRPGLVPPRPGEPNGLLDLGGTFGLHPAMAASHTLFQAHQFLVVHAVAGPYRVRSHFEAQDCLESGATHRMTSGWLNRVAGALHGGGGQPTVHIPSPSGGAIHLVAGGRGTDGNGTDGRGIGGQGGGGSGAEGQGAVGLANAIAVGASVPLLLRGSSPVANWAPHGFGEAPVPLYQAILALNAPDRTLGPAIAAGLRDRGFGDQATGGMKPDDGKPGGRFGFQALARAAGEMLRAPDGPRLAALEIGGWDTHTGQLNRLNGPLSQLDAGIDALRSELGDAWRRTAVLVMTEFGRTARMNGTNGTDHGTATVAFVTGGAVSGGRVAGTWPGLAPAQLFENRDLAPTTDLRSVAKGLLSAHLGLRGPALEAVFPDSRGAQPMAGLIATG